MTTCDHPGCGLRTRVRYPGNDPEGGPPRRYCASGHAACYACGVTFQAKCEDVEHDYCETCEATRCGGCGESTSQPECPLADRNGSALCYVCEHDDAVCEHFDVCRCDGCVARRVELARQLRVGAVTVIGLMHGAYGEWMDSDEIEISSHPLAPVKFCSSPTVVGSTYRYPVGAPGVGHRVYYALTEDGFGLLVEDTVREMEPWETR